MENQIVPPLSPLQKGDSFEEKIDGIIEYLHLGVIRCEVVEPITEPIKSSEEKFTVTQLDFPGPTPEYLKDYLDTAWLYLEATLSSEIEKGNGFYDLRNMLTRCRKKCSVEIGRFDFKNVFTFRAIHMVVIRKEGFEYPTIWGNLSYQPYHWQEMEDQCLVRQAFLVRLRDYIDDEFTKLINIPEISAKVQWNSPKAEMEITELLYALRLAGRITLAEDLTEPQFRERFFNLFGLSDKQYNKRTNEIRRRSGKSVFLKELVRAIDESK